MKKAGKTQELCPTHSPTHITPNESQGKAYVPVKLCKMSWGSMKIFDLSETPRKDVGPRENLGKALDSKEIPGKTLVTKDTLRRS